MLFFSSMTVEQLIKLIPEKEFNFLSAETKVDHQVKKLYGSTIFKLILFSMLNSSKLSLRVMEAYLKSAQFKNFAGITHLDTKYNSIRDRISTIDCTYFEALFDAIFKKYNHHLKECKDIVKVDSTFISIPTKLLEWGMRNGCFDKHRHIKLTISVKGTLPCSVQLYTAQSFVNESIALPDAILKNKFLKESVIVFDRGLQTRKKFAEFSQNNILFVGRVKTDIDYRLIKNNTIDPKQCSKSVKVIKDIDVKLISNGKILPETFRLVKAEILKTNQPIYFITNYFDVAATEIATIYKRRWEIELFFKFLKQHLNLKHIISRNENAMKVMIYMTLILSILILAYKKENSVKGYKIAKLKFEIELDNLMMKEVVILCGGDPAKAPHLFNSA
jgi:hypothetical protein